MKPDEGSCRRRYLSMMIIHVGMIRMINVVMISRRRLMLEKDVRLVWQGETPFCCGEGNGE